MSFTRGKDWFRPRDFGQSQFSSGLSLTSNTMEFRTPSATVNSWALRNPGMFRPLAEEAEAGNMLSSKQCKFLQKYFNITSWTLRFCLDFWRNYVCEERPIPDLVKQGFRRPLVPQILDLMKDSLASVMKAQDKGLLRASVRLGSALVPL